MHASCSAERHSDKLPLNAGPCRLVKGILVGMPQRVSSCIWHCERHAVPLHRKLL